MSEVAREVELTLKDRINFEYLLANQILTFQKAILNLEFSEREIREAIEGFVNLIPENWKDKKFKNDIDEAKIKVDVDMRMEFCGIKPSVEYCKEVGIVPFKEVETFNYYKMFQACINLLDRKKMLSRVQRIEELENIDFDAITNDATVESEIQTK